MFLWRSVNRRDLWVTAVCLTIFLLLMLNLRSQALNERVPLAQDPFFTFTFALNPGVSIPPTYQVNSNRDINFSLQVVGTSPVDLEIRNGANTVIWTDTVEGGETAWGSTTLTPTTNTFTLTNTGGTAVTITLKLFNIPTAPYDWNGVASPVGLNSTARVNFPTSGLYTFNFGVNSNGRYEFMLDTDYLQKTIEANRSQTYYVEAGVHEIMIVQDDGGSNVTWSVGIAPTGQTADSLPFTQSGTQIFEEWVPIRLTAATSTNLLLDVSGTSGDSVQIEIVGGNLRQPEGGHTVYTGESFWMTTDLPAGTSLLHLTATAGAVDYDLTISSLAAVPYNWTGEADFQGENSHIRLTFNTAGRYNFNFSSNGRYQFILQVNDDDHIQKTIEGNSNVIHYVPTGTHDLYIDQDTAVGAEWGVNISLSAAGNNPLPYSRSGGEIGGVGNDFTEEWLPISLTNGQDVNLSIVADGAADDNLRIEVYQGSDNTADFIIDPVFGSEKLWANFHLNSGINYLRLIAPGGNAAPMSYDSLTISAIPTNGTTSWDGDSLDTGLNSAILVNFTNAGLYHFEINSTEGFANLNLGNTTLHAPEGGTPLTTSFDAPMTAGVHEITVIQDNSFAFTEWTASVAPTTQAASFFNFAGTLAIGESVVPEYTVAAPLDFNFAFTVAGGDVDLTIRNGANNIIWDGTALDGEMVWGTGTLNGRNTLTLTNDDPSDIDIDLTLYHIPTAGYDWAGISDATGVNSHVRVNFPSDGLYTFDMGVNNGRYQFLLDDEYIQKTAESSASATFFVPAGVHDLYLDQDSGSGANWDIGISNVGAAHDTLPYMQDGGNIGGVNDFTQEWLPVNLSVDTEVNMKTVLTGTDGDSATVKVFDETDVQLVSALVYANETHWTTFDLPAGTNRIEVTADPGNVGPLSFSVVMYELPEPTYTWTGTADWQGENSHARVIFPADGLYTFDLGAANGRYQFLLNDNYIQKTVEGSSLVSYFVPAGTHDLFIDQDSTLGVDWTVIISGPMPVNDTLPYVKAGGDIGGTDNDFTEEWLPIHTGEAGLVNIAITLTGSMTDSLSLQLWDSVTQTMELAPVYGAETVWTTTQLPADARLRLLTDGGNNGPLSYEIAVHEIPFTPYAWNGRSLANGANSNIQIDVPLNGTYHVELSWTEGFGNIYIDGAQQRQLLEGGIAFDIDLTAGLHDFTVVQIADPINFPATTWMASIDLVAAEAPQLTAVDPSIAYLNTMTTITLTGVNLAAGAVVELSDGTSTHALGNVTRLSNTQLTAVVPNTVPLGTYDVTIINPDDQQATLTDALTVIQAEAPQLTAVTPDVIIVGTVTTVTLTGVNMAASATVELSDGTNTYILGDVMWLSNSQITAVVPNTVPLGTYDVTVINPDDQQATLTNGLMIVEELPTFFTVFLPFVARTP